MAEAEFGGIPALHHGRFAADHVPELADTGDDVVASNHADVNQLQSQASADSLSCKADHAGERSHHPAVSLAEVHTALARQNQQVKPLPVFVGTCMQGKAK